MATTQPVVKFTYEDYRTAPADKRYELLDGDLLMVPAPNLKHQRVQMALSMELNVFIRERALGELFSAPCDVVLSDTDIVQPDLLFVSRERGHLLSGGENVRGAPDLVIEILSPATADRDRGYKRALYGRHGVTEYWLVDPIAETVLLHRQRAGVLAVTHTFGRGQTLRSPLLPGLELQLDSVFSSHAWRAARSANREDLERGVGEAAPVCASAATGSDARVRLRATDSSSLEP